MVHLYAYLADLTPPKVIRGHDDQYWLLDALKGSLDGAAELKARPHVPNQGHGVPHLVRGRRVSALHRYSVHGNRRR